MTSDVSPDRQSAWESAMWIEIDGMTPDEARRALRKLTWLASGTEQDRATFAEVLREAME